MLLVVCSEQQASAQEDQFLAQLILQLGAMQVHGNVKSVEDVISKKHTMALLHVQKFNREHIRGTLQFLASEQQGRVMLLPRPPLDRRCHCGERRERGLAQYAEQVDIRELRMEFPI